MRQKLSETIAKNLPAPTKPYQITYDTELPGFGLRVTRANARSFILNYTIAGRERRYTIGRWPTWSVAAARNEAKRLRQLIDQGQDPQRTKKEDREAPTVQDLWETYQSDHLPTLATRSQKDIRSMWENHILPELGSTKLRNLTSEQIDRFHKGIKTGKGIRANRVLQMLRKALNIAVRREWIEKNPASGFKANQANETEDFLTVEELVALVGCLDRMSNKQAANVVRLLVFTGARAGEVFRSDWSQFDLKQGIWTKPSSHTKQRKVHRVPLSAEALALLQEMETEKTSFFLFPSRTAKPILDIKKPWQWVRREMKMPTLRVHDLRHAYASVLVSSGESLPVIGRLLGHTQHKTTMRYAHLMDRPLRTATNKVSQLVSGSTKPFAKANDN